MTRNTEANDVPTATEFIPREGECDDVRYLQATGDGGLEEVNTEPAQSEVKNHVYICDECGQSENLQSDMAFHLDTQHYPHESG